MSSKRETEALALGPEGARRTYHLTWPKVGERTQYRHAVAKAGGKRHSQLAMLVLGWLALWLACRGGRSPHAGGVADQPARLMAIFALMDETLAELLPKAESG
jgi:hypothetical protein